MARTAASSVERTAKRIAAPRRAGIARLGSATASRSGSSGETQRIASLLASAIRIPPSGVVATPFGWFSLAAVGEPPSPV